MGEGSWGCLKMAAVGCGGLIVLAVGIPLILAVMMVAPFQNAIDDRFALDELFGTQESFTPPASGVPAPERIEVFLAVRRDLAPISADLEKAEMEVANLESIDQRDDVSSMQAVRQALSTSRSMMGVGPVIGRYYEVRNASLMTAEMGLGEFTYIFVMAYHTQLLEPPRETQLFGPGPVNSRVRAALRSMLEHQLEVMIAESFEAAEIDLFEAEVAALYDDSSRLPWQDGLPPAIAEAFLPFRTELDELYFPAAAPLELMINEKRGLAIEGN